MNTSRHKKGRQLLARFGNLLFANMPQTIAMMKVKLDELNLQNSSLGMKLDLLQRQQRDQLINRGYVQISDNVVLAKIFSGAKFYLDPRDIALVPHLILDGEWEREITNAWLRVVNDGDTIIDIGANFGYFGVLAAQQANRNCSVFLFEANPGIIPYLQKTINVNSLDDCSQIENFALSHNDGEELLLNVLQDYIASSSILKVDKLNNYKRHGEMYRINKQVQIKSLTLDTYCTSHHIYEVNLIKMDIEGYEDIAYEGMRNIVKSSPNLTMFVEFTKKSYRDPKKFYSKMLGDFGHVYLIDGQGNFIKQDKTSFDAVADNNDDWTMLVFSKRSDLHHQNGITS